MPPSPSPLAWWQWLIIALAAVFGGIGAWHLWNWGQTIASGLQQAAPALGAMVGSVGMLFAVLPAMLMMMMFMWMFSTITRVFGE
jgi:hypothetical protein